MKINKNRVSLAKDILINSSDIETIIAINYIKKVKQFVENLKLNVFNFNELDKFIKECLVKYVEIIDIIEEMIDDNIYLFKKDYYLSRLNCVEIGIYTHILLIKGKIDDVYDIMYSIE